ncbi:ATP-dependent RNA helicase [Hondaea fermentalgiana]|uniref:ATP-dependent RNA helicase n=1 Tax=Hondaea fermentalgiana TaxID=2315210 RepID=A0A2R5G429_9STRA|nr:ATP-dependent RNA helicase [Hondaea fermentalgiana]|eukprot:GBG25750.1 ATP-dependent RNA helicase [Hondaea fermentalgiana]
MAKKKGTQSGAEGAGGAAKVPTRGKGKAPINFVDESYKIRIDRVIEDFKRSGEAEFRFPSSLNNTERRYVHEVCKKEGLASKSRGKGDDRYLTVSRKVVSKNADEEVPRLDLGRPSEKLLADFFTKFPISKSEEQNARARSWQEEDTLFPADEDYEDSEKDAQNGGRPAPARYIEPAPLPTSASTTTWDEHFTHVGQARRQLPVWAKRDEILRAVEACDVTVITGETGCGKSTQIPQYLMEMQSRQFNIVCTQPRRLSAVALADRVASENGTGDVGDVVGYSVRLECKRSEQTRLLYCTTGVLLRELAHSPKALERVTHLVIDEVHERDINSDFLLMIVRELLLQQKKASSSSSPGQTKLKLVLMSATMQVNSFLQYFSNTHYFLTCQYVKVPGKLFSVHKLFLEDVLSRTNYVDRLMERNKRIANALASIADRSSAGVGENDASGRRGEDLDFGVDNGTAEPVESFVEPEEFVCQLCEAQFSSPGEFGAHAAFCTGPATQPASAWDVGEDNDIANGEDGSNEIVATWESAWNQADDDDDDDDDDDVNDGDPGNSNDLEDDGMDEDDEDDEHENEGLLLGYGIGAADKPLDAPLAANGAVAVDDIDEGGEDMDASESMKATDAQIVLDQYQYARQLTGLDDDTQLDIDLVVEVLQQIEQSHDDLSRFVGRKRKSVDAGFGRLADKGSVLIFLSGWDEIAKLCDALQDHPLFGDESRFLVLPLHSGVTPASQRQVFKRAPRGVRKIICSTNIAETSVTIDDVVYVIDLGTSKTKRYDPHTKVSSLTNGIIAKANAIQRSGRAGRVRSGICFRMYSRTRYDAMLEEEAPEMQRTALEEVCLQSCVLLEKRTFSVASMANKRVFVRNFLGRAPDAPQDISVRNALNLLFELGAIGTDEKLTPLGHALARLPLDPRLGKMVLIGTMLGVKEQAVTLAAFFATGRDPFVIPLTAADRKRFETSRHRLTGGEDGDHVACFRAYEEYSRMGRSACGQYFLSPSIMNTVVQTRRQIMSLLPRMPVIDFRQEAVSTATLIEILASIGTFPNVALQLPGSKSLRSGPEKKILPHKSSVLRLEVSEAPNAHVWVVFDEMTRSRHFCSIRGCSRVLPVLVALFRGVYTLDTAEDGTTRVHLNEWVELCAANDASALQVAVLRDRLEILFARSLVDGKKFSEDETAAAGALLRLIATERTGQKLDSSQLGANGVQGGRGRVMVITHREEVRVREVVVAAVGAGVVKGSKDQVEGAGEVVAKAKARARARLSAGENEVEAEEVAEIGNPKLRFTIKSLERI